jgi:hypothetical protein
MWSGEIHYSCVWFAQARNIKYDIHPLRFREIHPSCQISVVQVEQSHCPGRWIASFCEPIEGFVFLCKLPRPSHRIRSIIGGNLDMLILLLSHTTWFYRSDSFLLLSLAVHPVKLPASITAIFGCPASFKRACFPICEATGIWAVRRYFPNSHTVLSSVMKHIDNRAAMLVSSTIISTGTPMNINLLIEQDGNGISKCCWAS